MMTSTFLLYSLLFIPIIFTIFITRWLNTKTQKNSPPSPPKLPIIGNLHQLGEVPHRSLYSLSQKYGELMLLHLGKKPTIIISSANAAKEITKTHDLIFSNRPRSKIASKLLYGCRDVVFSSYGEYWRQMKSVCVLQLLNTTRVRSFRAIREEETALMVESIKETTSSVVNLSEKFMKLTNDVVCRTAFGRKYSGEGGGNFKGVLKNFVELMGEFAVGDYVPWLYWVDRVNGLVGRVGKVEREFDEIIERILEEHLDGMKRKGDRGECQDAEEMKDFVDVLLEFQRETVGFPKDRECIKALILDMFAAGTDTTATLLEWAMSELLKHPNLLAKLQQEVRTIAQGKNVVNEPDLEKMEYLKAVIKETLRLHPPLPLLIPRESNKEAKVCGYEIEPGSQVLINAWAIQRDPSFWENPNEFNPERFLSSTVDFKGQDYQLIPFGAGRRTCPGILFGTISAELALANLVYTFDWALSEGVKPETLDMIETGGITGHRQHPLLAVPTPCLST